MNPGPRIVTLNITVVLPVRAIITLCYCAVDGARVQSVAGAGGGAVVRPLFLFLNCNKECATICKSHCHAGAIRVIIIVTHSPRVIRTEKKDRNRKKFKKKNKTSRTFKKPDNARAHVFKNNIIIIRTMINTAPQVTPSRVTTINNAARVRTSPFLEVHFHSPAVLEFSNFFFFVRLCCHLCYYVPRLC